MIMKKFETIGRENYSIYEIQKVKGKILDGIDYITFVFCLICRYVYSITIYTYADILFMVVLNNIHLMAQTTLTTFLTVFRIGFTKVCTHARLLRHAGHIIRTRRAKKYFDGLNFLI